jgi:hypothetical protein
VISIDKNEFGDEVYTRVYGNYVFRDDSRYVFEGPAYKNYPPDTIPGIELLSYFLAATNAYDLGELDEFKALEIQAAIAAYARRDDLRSFEIDFSSPGEYVIYAKNAAKAAVIALLVAATSDDILYTDARAATIVNSSNKGDNASLADTCPVPIQDEFKDIMSSIGASRHNAMCKVNKAAQHGVGLRTGVRVKKR